MPFAFVLGCRLKVIDCGCEFLRPIAYEPTAYSVDLRDVATLTVAR